MRLGLSRLRIAKDGDWPVLAAIGREAVGAWTGGGWGTQGGSLTGRECEADAGRIAGLIARRLAPRQRHPAPAGRSQARGLLEAAGEVALVGEAALLGDLGQLLLAAEQLGLGQMDLAVEQELLGCEAEQFGEAAVEVERAQMQRFGDVDQRGSTVE